MSDPSTKYVQVTTSASSQAEAQQIGHALVEQRLAACVQIAGPVQSVYRWQGQIEQAEEWLCLAKSEHRLFAAIETAVRQLHPYDCPEVIATPIVNGSETYLNWLSDQVKPSS